MEQDSIILSVNDEDVSKRLDIYLSEKFPKYSRTFFKNLIEEQNVKVNNCIIDKPSYALHLNDLVQFQFPNISPIKDIPVLNEDLGVDIIFEHKDFLIIYKPANLMVHKPVPKSDVITLVDWIIVNFKELANVGYTDRPGIVHRLDKDTSGLLIITKNNFAHMTFGKMFKEREIEKTYYAIVQGHPEEKGTIDLKISRDLSCPTKMTARYNTGRDAITNYKVVEYLKESALVKVNPITGRTHQIRVHLAAIGHAILGDSTYGKSSKLISRQALHAQKLAFIYEDTYYCFQVNFPQDFFELLEKLKI